MKLDDVLETKLVDRKKLQAAMDANKKRVERDEKWREKYYKKGSNVPGSLVPKKEFNKKKETK